MFASVTTLPSEGSLGTLLVHECKSNSVAAYADECAALASRCAQGEAGGETVNGSADQGGA